MSNLMVICLTLVVVVAIVGVLTTVEKCSYYKWRAKNPKAFEAYELHDESED